MISKKNRVYISKGFSDFVTRCSRNWFPVALLLLLLAMMSGFFGQGLGLPELFRDDEALWAYNVGKIIRSSLIWGHASATLLILALWAGIYLQDELNPKTAKTAGNELFFSTRVFLRYIGVNSWPFFILLPAAAYLNTDPDNIETTWVADFFKSIGGIVLGLTMAASSFALVRYIIFRIWNRVQDPIGQTFPFNIIFQFARIPLYEAVKELNHALLKNFLDKLNQNGELVGFKYWLRVLLYALIVLIVTGLFTIYPTIVPSVALCVLFIWIVGTYFILSSIKPAIRTLVIIGFGAAFYINGLEPYPNRFPDFGEDAYGAPLELPSYQGTNPSLLNPISSLNSWRQFLASDRLSAARLCDPTTTNPITDTPANFKPPLVVISTAGGAYRSGFWVSKVLDQLLLQSQSGGKLEGLFDHVRLLTGASGGMVGSAYLAALAPNPCDENAKWMNNIEKTLRSDISASRNADEANGAIAIGKFKTNYPIDRDSLAPVAQQILQRDIPRYLLSPIANLVGLKNTLFDWNDWGDRGLVLEQQWGQLAPTFADFKSGEAAGWRPSLMFTPMLIETGQPLIVSNLDSSDLTSIGLKKDGLAMEMFKIFPEMQERLKIQTALRMNATFPYVSPAVSLPTIPSLRVVDAGYYDNHGVSIAATWLQQEAVRKWIKANTSGVILIQIRAFATEVQQDAEHKNTSTQWLTSPLSGVGSARGNGSRARNDQLLENLGVRTESTKRLDLKRNSELDFPIHSIIFENTATSKEASMSWYLPESELRAMDKEFSDKQHNQAALSQLQTIWSELRSKQ